MKKYIGEIFWIEGNYRNETTGGGLKSKVNRAILNDDVFKIDHQNPNDAVDSLITIRTKDGFTFDGSMKFMDEKTHAAVVNFKLYNNKKNVLLIGDWIENGIVYNCIIELTEVKEFKI